jgi:predicted PurR-regulated permease PerM
MITIRKKTFYNLLLVLVLGIISLLIIKSFIIPLIFTGILVYLFHPAYKKLIKIFRNHALTSLIMIIIILLIVIVPLTLIITEVSSEISTLEGIDIDESLNVASININERFNTNLNLTSQYHEVLGIVNNELSDLFYKKLPSFVFNVFVIVFFFYYFLKNYERESEYFKVFFERIRLFKINYKVKRLINGIIYGQILLRFLQALVGGLLFFFIGLEGAFLWGLMMFFAAFLPLVGTALIWAPLMFIQLILGDYNMAIYIFLIGIVVSLIDNLLFPFIISERINIGPVVTLISILGGIELFGIYGVILGPFFLGLLFVFLDELFLRFRDDKEVRKRYVWTRDERDKYKSLKTNIAKEEYTRMLNKKYEIEEAKKGEVKYRYDEVL